MGNIIKIIFIVGVVGAGVRYYKTHSSSGGTGGSTQVRGKASAAGFVAIPRPAEMPRGRVLIVAPPHCPSSVGRRADEMERQLKAAQIPYVRTGSVSFPLIGTEAEVDRLRAVMDAPPVVFINGKAKGAPSTDEIVAEFRSAR